MYRNEHGAESAAVKKLIVILVELKVYPYYLVTRFTLQDHSEVRDGVSGPPERGRPESMSRSRGEGVCEGVTVCDRGRGVKIGEK